MKPSLQLKISQHLALTPQLQQSIRLLQLSSLELNQEIEQVLLENPMLERETADEHGDVDEMSFEVNGADTYDGSDHPEYGEVVAEPEAAGFDADDAPRDADWMSDGTGHQGSGSNDEDDESDSLDFQSSGISLRTHLENQLLLMHLSQQDKNLVRFLIEALDENGYLTQSLEELLELLPQELELELDDLQVALQYLKNLDVPGIGARNLQECLLMQLQQQAQQGVDNHLARSIVDKYLDLLAARDFARLKKMLGCNDEEMRQAHMQICALDPKPGARFSQEDATRYIVPDVIVKKVRGQWTAMLNQDTVPKLRIHRLYADILRNNRGTGGALMGQMQEAKWLIKNVQQRYDTILRTSQLIVERQRAFFDYGDVAMRPLTLREIAEELELHESTISRVTTQKYMATPCGVFELKYFFGSHVSTDTGGACSATAIRALIRQLVNQEDRRRPLSDAKIADALGQQGIMVARRTVAKYRESLNIPAVSQRKSI